MKKETLKILIPAIVNLYIVWIMLMSVFLGIVKPTIKAFDADENGTVAVYKRKELIVIGADGVQREYFCEVDDPWSISLEGSYVKIMLSNIYILFNMEEETMSKRFTADTEAPRRGAYRTVAFDDTQFTCREKWLRPIVVEKHSDGSETIRYSISDMEYLVKLGLIVFGISLFVIMMLLLVHITKNYSFTNSGRIIPKQGQ